jgi:MFS family permease
VFNARAGLSRNHRYLSTILNLNVGTQCNVVEEHMVSVARMPYRLRESFAFLKWRFPVLLVLFNSFSWYFLGQLLVRELRIAFEEYHGLPLGESSTGLLLAIAFPVSIILSALAGSILLPKMKRSRVILGWLVSGTIASLLPAIPINDSFGTALAVIVALGSSLGSGMPLLLRHFTESLPAENRGTIGGLAFFMVTVSAPLLFMATLELNLHLIALVLALWRGWSIPCLLMSRINTGTPAQHERRTTFRDLFSNRAFVLYFIAWLLFSMVDGFAGSAISQYIRYETSGELYDKLDFGMNVIEPLCAGISALAGGIIADRTGRRRVVISGFVSLGIAYAVLGVTESTGSVLGITWQDFSLPLYFVVDGFAIGLLWTMFTIVIWGELAARGTEKYYALGEASFFLTQILYLLSTPYFQSELQTSFTLAAFFLFIAVIPLFYAPETLPEKKIQERQLRVYTEEAIKLKQKRDSV